MLRILSGTIIVVVFLVGGVFLFGFRAGPEIDASLFLTMDYGAEYLYGLITDIEGYSNRKKNIVNIEILERKGTVITRWRENYERGVWQEYKILEKYTPEIFSVEMVRSSNSHSGVIKYQLTQKDNLTEILLTEKGRIENPFWRGLHYLAGENSFLEEQAKWLRVAIIQDLLKRK